MSIFKIKTIVNMPC